MNKIDIDKIVDHISYKFDEREVSNLYMMDNHKILKVFDGNFLIDMVRSGYDIERKVLYHDGCVSDGIISPCDAVYYKKKFIGYTMPFFNGVSIFNAYESGYFNDSLYKYAEFFSKLENIISFNDRIVFTDLLSVGNVMVNANDDIRIIDFDDLQVGDYPTPTLSSGLGDRSIYWNSKYIGDGLYTKELDIKSLIYLYFNLVFCVDLCLVDKCSDDSYKKLLLEKIFNGIHLNDDIMINKVLRLYDNDVCNLYLGDTLYRFAEEYTIGSPDGNCKKLYRR